MNWLLDKLYGRSCVRSYNELSQHDFASMKQDLQLAIELIEQAEGREEDGNHCTASNFYAEAIHTVKAAIGQRVRVPLFGFGMPCFTLRHYLLGYRSPSSPEVCGKRPTVRILKDEATAGAVR